jgi:hypothetical protein
MGRTRDVSKILTSNTSILSLASASATYATKTSIGSTLIIPSTISNTGGSASIATNGTVSFTSASAISLNNVFSSTYDNYAIILDSNPSTTLDLSFRFRTSGTDNSNANYQKQQIFTTSTTVAGARIANATSLGLLGTMTTRTFFNLIIVNPSLSLNTGLNVTLNADYSSATPYLAIQSNSFNSNTIFDGFTIIASTGNITGSVSVYGYNK